MYDINEIMFDVKKNIKKLLLKLTVIVCAPIIFFGTLAAIVFNEPYFDKYTTIVVKQYLWWDMAMLFVFATLTVLFAITFIRSIKKKYEPKWAHFLWIVFLIICVFQTFNIYNVIHDIKNESYISYKGEFSQNNDGYTLDTKTTTLANGLRLKSRSSLIENGNYVGVVVYTERSEIAVEVQEVEPNE